jgi:subtilisin family serine protease
MSTAHDPVFGIPDDLVLGEVFSSLSAAPTSWGMAAMHIDILRAAGGDGRGEVIAVLDTGADPSHTEFIGRWHHEPWSDVPGESFFDKNGHAAHCMGTAAGVSPSIGVANKARLMAGKCLSDSGQGNTSWIRASFTKALRLGATVISISIGGRGFLPAMEDLFAQAARAGVVVLVAAGNERAQGGLVTTTSSALVVAAVDSAGKYARFSNPAINGEILAFAAPGVNIVSAKPGGGYQTMSGTSMATPNGAGVIAAYQSARVAAGLRRFTTGEFKALFTSRAVDAGPVGPDQDYGPGLIDGNLLRLTLTPDPVVA